MGQWFLDILLEILRSPHYHMVYLQCDYHLLFHLKAVLHSQQIRVHYYYNILVSNIVCVLGYRCSIELYCQFDLFFQWRQVLVVSVDLLQPLCHQVFGFNPFVSFLLLSFCCLFVILNFLIFQLFLYNCQFYLMIDLLIFISDQNFVLTNFVLVLCCEIKN